MVTAPNTLGSAGAGLKKVFKTGLTEVHDTDMEGVGSIRIVNGGVYKYIQYDDGTGNVAGVAGKLVEYIGPTAWSDHKVTMDFSDGYNLCAGALQAAMTDGQYGWIQVTGYAELTTGVLEGSDVDGQLYTTNGASADGGAVAVNADAEVPALVSVDASADKVILCCPW